MNETKATLILACAPFLGPVKIRALIEKYGSAEFALLHAPSDTKLRKETIQYLTNFEKEKSWQEDLQKASLAHVQLLPFTDPRFPSRLKAVADCPPLLYIKGTLPSFDVPWIAIIGTRASTPYANEMADRFAADLARGGAVIVSGLARGVDTFAHKGCLQASKTGATTVAVIGSGLDHIYPT